MNFDDYISKLLVELKNTLPGFESQKLMVPKSRVPKGMTFEKDSIKKSGVLILLHPDKDDIYVSFIKRVTDGSKHSGQIAFPGGKAEEGDKNITETAVREAEEEIGVKSKDIKILGSLTPLFIPVSNYDVQPVVGSIHYKPEFIKSPDEVDEIHSVSIKELKEAYTICKTFEVRNETITAPFYMMNSIEIWGATAMMLSEFIELIKRLE